MDALTPTIPPPQPRHPAGRTRHTDPPMNVGDAERWLSLLGGGLLALATARRALGQCALYQTMGVCTASHEGSPDSARRVAEPDELPRMGLGDF